jgi:hypothetical protein
MKKLMILVLEYKLRRATNAAKRESDPIAKITKLFKVKDLQERLLNLKLK